MEKGEQLMNQTQLAQQLNGAALAYIGDAIYEVYAREHVLKSGYTVVNDLHQATIKYVSATSQAMVMLNWIQQENKLDSQEIGVYKRGRNFKAYTKAKNASIQDYRQATGFEALIGWLYLTDNRQRLETLIQDAFSFIDSKEEET